MNGKTNLPKSVIDEWPEIFNEVIVNRLPLPYLQGIRITFNDGKSWEIAVTGDASKNTSFSVGLLEIMDSYRENIDNVSIKVNTKKIKKDVNKSISKLLRKLKL